MRSLKVLALLLSPLAVSAQYGYGGGDSSGSSTTAAVAAAATTAAAPAASQSGLHIVTVGQNGFVYTPDTITAAVGDKVQFQFYPQNHSVVQSSFSSPCQPLSSTSFFSGFMPVTSGVGTNSFTITINDTNPIWFYCAQVTHCQGGMAGVINPPSSGNTLAEFKAAASNTKTSQPAQAQGGVIAAIASNASVSTSPSPSATKASAGVKDVNADAAARFVVAVGVVVAGFML